MDTLVLGPGPRLPLLSITSNISSTPPTWSWCQCEMIMSLIRTRSSINTFCRWPMYSFTFASPVSSRIRLWWMEKGSHDKHAVTRTARELRNYLLPLPMRYVLVPCSVIGLGLQPRIRISREEILLTAGIVAMVPVKMNG